MSAGRVAATLRTRMRSALQPQVHTGGVCRCRGDACERERYGCDVAEKGQWGWRGQRGEGGPSHMPENVNHVRVHEALVLAYNPSGRGDGAM